MTKFVESASSGQVSEEGILSLTRRTEFLGVPGVSMMIGCDRRQFQRRFILGRQEGQQCDQCCQNKRLKLDNPVKSAEFVMPDLIRHPESIEVTGFRPTPE